MKIKFAALVAVVATGSTLLGNAYAPGQSDAATGAVTTQVTDLTTSATGSSLEVSTTGGSN